MKNFNAVIKIINLLSDNLSAPIISDDHNRKRPTPPFGIFKIISKRNNEYVSNKKTNNYGFISHADTNKQKEYFTVQLTFIGNDISELYELSDNAYNYLNIIPFEKKYELGIQIDLTYSIKERKIFVDLDSNYNLRFDFNIIVDKSLEVLMIRNIQESLVNTGEFDAVIC